MACRFRAANRAAEDVLVECEGGQSDGVLLKEVAGIEERIAVELKHIAVKMVGAMHDRPADDRATGTVVLGIERAFSWVKEWAGLRIFPG